MQNGRKYKSVSLSHLLSFRKNSLESAGLLRVVALEEVGDHVALALDLDGAATGEVEALRPQDVGYLLGYLHKTLSLR